MLKEFQISLTVDSTSGQATSYILEMEEDSQWIWIADHEFGPFDTAYDITRWMTKVLVNRRAVHLR